jgi:hypothetical protein
MKSKPKEIICLLDLLTKNPSPHLNDANLIVEELILDALEKASNYEMGVARLDEKGKGIVTKFRKFAGACCRR